MISKRYVFPTVALRGITLLPHQEAQFDVGREELRKAIRIALLTDNVIFVVSQKDFTEIKLEPENLCKVGVIAKITQVVEESSGALRVKVDVSQRAKLIKCTVKDYYLSSEVEAIDDHVEEKSDEIEAMIRQVREEVGACYNSGLKMPREIMGAVLRENEPHNLINLVASTLLIKHTEKQQILEAETICDQLVILLSILQRETTILKIQEQYRSKVKEKIEESQKEYILREEMKAIKNELGEDDLDNGADEYRKRIEELNADDVVKNKLKKELNRLERTPAASSENAVIRTYIETLLELPWNDVDEEYIDLRRAEKVLSAEHYGMEKVKERVLEYLAVRALTNKSDSQIICLVGPPGTGKTSIVRSIAKALDKSYVRISLGGVNDEAEIRGHRKTYIGSMPGRIIEGLREAKVGNPVMLLDEIDKVGSDQRGDTSSALLEVLDPDQNVKFRDHYVELPVDLSKVFFIATANSLQNVSKPLLDRMDVIEVSGYTENEKMHIVKEHLLRKQLVKNGLSKDKLSISDGAIRDIIGFYTRESGVREVDRKISEICRKAAKSLYSGEAEKISVTQKNLSDFLGKKIFRRDKKNEKGDIGIARGLAWTSVGGDTLEVEVNVLPGDGSVELTGNLGDVMKESAITGLSYIRSIASSYGIDKQFFKENDVHIHLPEGAVPKDGPSAGVTMAVAMLSALTNKRLRADVAMTGEITLRGRILPVGGLKEKVLAAKTAGFTTVLVPAENKADIEELSEEISGGLEIVFINKFDDAYKIIAK